MVEEGYKLTEATRNLGIGATMLIFSRSEMKQPPEVRKCRSQQQTGTTLTEDGKPQRAHGTRNTKKATAFAKQPTTNTPCRSWTMYWTGHLQRMNKTKLQLPHQ